MNPILQFLQDQYLYDMRVLFTPWVYLTIFPFIVYSIIFFIKWSLITGPIWIPLSKIKLINSLANRVKSKNKD